MLKVLELKEKRDKLDKELAEIRMKKTNLLKRSEDLKEEIEGADDTETGSIEERVSTIESDIEGLLSREKDLNEKIKAIEDEIKGTEEEEDIPPADESERRVVIKMENRNVRANRYETRSEMLDRLNAPQVREFYKHVTDAIKNKRGVVEPDLLIPEQVIDMIGHR